MNASSSQEELLNGLLADLINLALLAKHAHWNVVGPSFREMHVILDEVAATARDAADDLAERGRALGLHPDGRVPVVSRSELPSLEPGPIRDVDAMDAFDVILAGMGARLQAALQDFDGDPVTQDLITSTLGACEQHAWLIRAHCYEVPT